MNFVASPARGRRTSDQAFISTEKALMSVPSRDAGAGHRVLSASQNTPQTPAFR
jgi:hypothetical protein